MPHQSMTLIGKAVFEYLHMEKKKQMAILYTLRPIVLLTVAYQEIYLNGNKNNSCHTPFQLSLKY